MNAADNERGGVALLYVFMVMLLLLAVSPFVLSVISNEANHGRCVGAERFGFQASVEPDRRGSDCRRGKVDG